MDLAYRPVLDAVGGSVLLTALAAMLPLLTLFLVLGVMRLPAWRAALASLAVSVVVAIVAYSMPAGQVLSAGLEGAAFGVFPILWIVINAIWVYNMTVVTGHFDVLRRSFAKVSDDQRIQAIIIAFCFGGLLEALAGFGTPVAITSVMLIAVGLRPIKAAVVALVANTAAVAFGALAVPLTTLSKASGIPEQSLSMIVGRQTVLLALVVPVVLVFIIDRWRGVRETLPATLTAGLSFALTHLAVSGYVSMRLTDVVASLVAAASLGLVLRVWRPADTYVDEPELEAVVVGAAGRAGSRRRRGGGAVRGMTVGDDQEDNGIEIVKAYAPYLIIVAVFALSQIPALKDALAAPTVKLTWPGLDLLSSSGQASALSTFTFNVFDSAGTLTLVAGLITIFLIGISPAKAWRAYLATIRQLSRAIVTIVAILGAAYVMNASGQTLTLGAWMAEAGAGFALLSPVLGWLGVAVTGSDTSSNALFGSMQVSAAARAGLDPAVMAAANASGGVLGKMVSPQNLAIAAAAVGLSGREGEIFRRVIAWSLGLLLVMCAAVYLQTTPVLGWMVP